MRECCNNHSVHPHLRKSKAALPCPPDLENQYTEVEGKNKTSHPEESCSIFLNGYTGVVRSKSIAPDEGWKGICASEIFVIPAEIIGSEIQIGRIIRNTGMNGAVEFWQIQRDFAVFRIWDS